MAPYKFTEHDFAKGNHLILFYVNELENYRYGETQDLSIQLKMQRNKLMQPFMEYRVRKLVKDEAGIWRMRFTKDMHVGEFNYLHKEKSRWAKFDTNKQNSP
jgi:hypothetical protein